MNLLNNHKLLLLAVLSTALSQLGVHGCPSRPATFETNYCRATSVIVALVKSKFYVCYGRPCLDTSPDMGFNGVVIYVLKVRKVFKGTISAGTAFFVTTQQVGVACGARLQVGSKYLINLFSVTGFWIDLCSGNRTWPVSRKERKFLRMNSKTNDSLCAGVPSSSPWS